MPDLKAPEPQVSPPEQAHTAYEKSDVRIGIIIRSGIGLVVGTVVVHVLILGLYALLARHAEALQPKLSPLVRQEQKILPRDLGAIPAPRLQVSDVGDYAAWKKSQTDKLQAYGWVDQKQGVVSLPIDQALQILADPKQQGKHGIFVNDKK